MRVKYSESFILIGKKLFFLLIILFYTHSLYATHNRAGEITFKHLNGLTYQINVVTYTKESAPTDRPSWKIEWGDGTSDTLLRSNGGGNGEIIAP